MSLLALLSPSSTKPAEKLSSCPAGFLEFGAGGCYHLVADGSFEQVQVACQSLGGTPMMLKSERENSEARVLMTKHLRAMAWIGLKKEKNLGTRLWDGWT